MLTIGSVFCIQTTSGCDFQRWRGAVILLQKHESEFRDKTQVFHYSQPELESPAAGYYRSESPICHNAGLKMLNSPNTVKHGRRSELEKNCVEEVWDTKYGTEKIAYYLERERDVRQGP